MKYIDELFLADIHNLAHNSCCLKVSSRAWWF